MVHKASLSNIRKNTPKKLKRLGNALFGFSTFISAGAYIGDYPKLALAMLFIGGIGKFITELFTDEPS